MTATDQQRPASPPPPARTGSHPGPRRTIWAEPQFRRWFWADSAQQTAGSLNQIALPLLATAVAPTPATAGLIVAASAVGATCALLPGGVLADHGNRRRVVPALALIGAALYLLLAGLTWLPRPSLWLVLPLIFGCGLVPALAAPAFSATLKRLVSPGRFPAASSAAEGRSAALALAAPAAGGVMFGLGSWSPFAASAVLLLAAAGWFLAIDAAATGPLPRSGPAQSSPARAGGPRWGLTDGVRFVVHDRTLRVLLGTAMGANLAASTVLLASIFHLRGLGVAPHTVGLLSSGIAVGSLVGAVLAALVVPRWRAGVTVLTALGWMLLGLVPLLLAGNQPGWVLVLLAVAVVSAPALNAVVGSYLVASVPTELQGRVDSVVVFIATATAPLAPLLAGGGLQLVGYPTTVAGCIIIGLIAALPSLLSARVRNLPRPEDWESVESA